MRRVVVLALFALTARGEDVLVVPGVGRIAGLGGAYFRTALAVTNPTTNPMTVRLRFVPANGEEKTTSILLAPRVMTTYADVLTELFQVEKDAAGAIYVDVDGARPVVTARSYNDTVAGTFGESIDARPIRGAASDATIYGLAREDTARVNIGGTAPMRIAIEQRAVDVPAAGQVNRIDAALGASSVFSAQVSSAGAVYAVRVENSTGDASLFTPQTAYREQFVAPAGAFGTDSGAERSTIVLTNPGETDASVDVEHYPGNSALTGIQTLTLPARTSQRFDDFITQRFGLPANLGYLRVVSTEPVVAWARSFAAAGYGHTVPVTGADQRLGARSIIHGLAENERFRARVSFVNTTSSTVSVKMTVVDPAGVVRGSLAVKSFGVSARQSYSFGLFATEMGFPNMGEYYVLVEPTVPDAVYVWATLIDRVSGDATLMRPARID